MRRRITVLLALVLFGAATLVGVTPGVASASPCNMTNYHNPDAPSGVANSIMQNKSWSHHSGVVNRQGCMQFGTNGGITSPQYRFRVEVQDMVDTLDPGYGAGDGWGISDGEGCTEVQWNTPGNNVWTTVASDCNSADWNTDIWWSPYLHRVLNGEPHQFQFRMRNTTRDLSVQHFFWSTHVALFGNWTTIPLVFPS